MTSYKYGEANGYAIIIRLQITFYSNRFNKLGPILELGQEKIAERYNSN